MEVVQNDPRVSEVYLGEAPSMSEEQINIIRIAASMAWADNNFAPEQLEVILSNLSREFSDSLMHQMDLQQELKNYLAKNIPLEELVPQLKNIEQREKVLRLSYEIIRSNEINEQEIVVYQRLLELLDLPTELIKEVETEIEAKYDKRINN